MSKAKFYFPQTDVWLRGMSDVYVTNGHKHLKHGRLWRFFSILDEDSCTGENQFCQTGIYNMPSFAYTK